MTRRVRSRVFALTLLFAVSACKVGENYQQPKLDVPPAFIASAPLPAGVSQRAEPPTQWWSSLRDEELAKLIDRARTSNLDLRAAGARVREARALYEVAGGRAGPQLNGRAGYAWQESSTTLGNSRFASSGPTQFFQAGFDAVWEVDLFGRNARAIEAARAGAESALEDSRDVLITLYAELARNYVELRAAQKETLLTRANLAVQQDTLDLVRVRAHSEMASEFDVARAEGQVATTRALLPQLEVRASEALHRISVLLGAEPNALASELSTPGPIPEAPAVTDTGIPSELLRRRPDIRRAERELAQAAALTAEATAELFPNLSLSGSLGVQSNSLAHLFDSDSGTFSVGPSLTAPIFNSGALRANVRAQGARQEQALVRYQESALVALREVEDALVASDRERTRLASLREALDAAKRALQLSRDLNREGMVDFFDVLDSQRVALSAESAVAQSEGALCADAIAVYKALGGGWEE